MADPVNPQDGEPPRERSPHFALGIALAYLLVICAGWVWLWIRERDGILATASVGTHGLGISMAIGLGVGLGLCGVFALGVRYVPALARLQDRLADLIGPLTDHQITVLALFSGLAEEFFFRLAMQDALGLVWASLVFGLWHIGPGGTLLWTAFAIAIGFLFGWMVEIGCGLLSVTVAHAIVNYVSLRRMNP